MIDYADYKAARHLFFEDSPVGYLCKVSNKYNQHIKTIEQALYQVAIDTYQIDPTTIDEQERLNLILTYADILRNTQLAFPQDQSVFVVLTTIFSICASFGFLEFLSEYAFTALYCLLVAGLIVCFILWTIFLWRKSSYQSLYICLEAIIAQHSNVKHPQNIDDCTQL